MSVPSATGSVLRVTRTMMSHSLMLLMRTYDLLAWNGKMKR